MPIAHPKHFPPRLKTAAAVVAFLIILFLGWSTINKHQAKYQGKIDHSQPSTYTNFCHLNLDEFKPRPCFINEKSNGPLVYLYGDSHAAQWVPALEIASRSMNFKLRVFTKSSCPYVYLNLNVNCNRWQEYVLHEISKNKPAVVIMASLTNAKYFSPLNNTSYSKLWMQNFENTINILNKKTQVILIEDTPYSLFDTSQCLMNTTSTKCSFKFKESNLTKSIRTFSYANNVNYLALNDHFCDGYLCLASNEIFNYYFDSHHISVSLSKSLGKTLSAYLELIIPEPN
jgi:hypothetical protein